MLGQPMAMLIPEVVGFELTGKLPAGATATDLVLTVTQMLRKKGVVDKFVEFYGAGIAALSLPDRATIANMAPEYGATMGFFPVDDETLAYLRFTGRTRRSRRSSSSATRKENLLWHDPTREAAVLRHAVARPRARSSRRSPGPARPQDRVPLKTSRRAWRKAVGGDPRRQGRRRRRRRSTTWPNEGGHAGARHARRRRATVTTDKGTFDARPRRGRDRRDHELHEHVEPVGAARRRPAREEGGREGPARRKPWVKTSLAPGSQVVTDYLTEAGLMAELEKLGFYLAGYGCTTCIGNSGPVARRDRGRGQGRQPRRRVGAVGQPQLRGPRQPGRARELPRVAAARRRVRARRHDEHRSRRPSRSAPARDGKPVFLKDVWPSPAEVAEAMRTAIKQEQYQHALRARPRRRRRVAARSQVPAGDTFAWDDASTYIRKPTFFDDLGPTPKPLDRHRGRARARGARRLGDDRSHLAGRQHREGLARPRSTSTSHGVKPRRLQPVRRAPRQPRGDGARHVREHPAQEPDARRRRGRLHEAPARRRADVDLRRGDAVRRTTASR